MWFMFGAPRISGISGAGAYLEPESGKLVLLSCSSGLGTSVIRFRPCGVSNMSRGATASRISIGSHNIAVSLPATVSGVVATSIAPTVSSLRLIT